MYGPTLASTYYSADLTMEAKLTQTNVRYLNAHAPLSSLLDSKWPHRCFMVRFTTDGVCLIDSCVSNNQKHKTDTPIDR